MSQKQNYYPTMKWVKWANHSGYLIRSGSDQTNSPPIETHRQPTSIRLLYDRHSLWL